MKTHTSTFKNTIKEFGREIDALITYEVDGETIELGNDILNSITPSYEGSILKSVMKQLILDSNTEIPIGTDIKLQFGIKVADAVVEDYRDNYEYLDFGHYIVKDVEKKEDTDSYEIKCYDKMLYAMKEYEMLDVVYPITIRSYINAIASKLGLVFKNASDTFANYDKEISQELFFSKQVEEVEEEVDGEIVVTEKTTYTSLGYTYRDILDQLAQVTASTICINEDDDELELRYINDTNDTIDEAYLKNINVNFGTKYGPLNSIVLSRSAESDNVYLQDGDSVETDGLCEIKIIDNQIMNFEDREDYLEDILDELNGLEYYINDFSSTGICYYNLCDKYNISIDSTTYPCIMFNDEVLITQGLEENIHTDLPENSETDYDKANKSDIKINKAILQVNKQEVSINALLQKVNEQDGTISRLEETTTSESKVIEIIKDQVNDGVVNNVQTETIRIDDAGINVATSGSTISTQITNDRFIIQNNGEDLAYFGYDENIGATKSEIDNLTVPNYFVTGVHRFETVEFDDEQRTGVFYIGE